VRRLALQLGFVIAWGQLQVEIIIGTAASGFRGFLRLCKDCWVQGSAEERLNNSRGTAWLFVGSSCTTSHLGLPSI
jgi:hypothetical protein